MNAICLITFRPNEIWCKFLNLFSNYNIFIIVDDDSLAMNTTIVREAAQAAIRNETNFLRQLLNFEYSNKLLRLCNLIKICVLHLEILFR
jgi:hypothetical protein